MSAPPFARTLDPRAAGTTDPTGRPTPEPVAGQEAGAARWSLYLCCILLVACTIPWRRGTYFSGGLDPVVLLKGAIGGAGLVLAFALSRRRTAQVRLGARTVVLATTYLVISVVGGWAAGTMLPSVVIAVRVGMLLASLAFLLQAFGIGRVVPAMLRTMGAVAALAIATGIGTLASGRLQGGIPPLAPNEIAFLCGALLLLTVHRIIERQAAGWEVAAAGLLGALVWLTGSRTTAATLAVALAVMVVQARRFSVPAFLAMVLAVPAVAYAALATTAVSDMLLRGGSQNVTTLSSRTIAWQAALTMDTSTYQRWFGGGLTMKHIPVSGQYWATQLLDSSWVSALVQTGILGLVLIAVWVLSTSVAALRTPRPWRPLWTGLLVFIVFRSLLESGLFDASTSFIVFALVSLASEPSARVAGAGPEDTDTAPHTEAGRNDRQRVAAAATSTPHTASR
ncbi:O-antigen ligase family protein [Pedococcus soli]